MIKWLTHFSLVVAAFALMTPLADSSSFITLYTDKPSYTAGQTVYVYGAVSSVVQGERVNITIVNPQGRLWAKTYSTPDARGNYGAVVGVISPTDSTGTYRVLASYLGYVESKTFQVRTPLKVTVKTDKQVYLTNETVSASGTATPYIPGYPITLYINDTITIKAVAQTTPLPNGSFYCTDIYRVQPGDRGAWTIVASYGNMAESASTFYVGLYVNVDLQSNELRPGELFHLRSRVSFVVGGQVSVEVRNPAGDLWFTYEAPVDAGGNYTATQPVYPYDKVGVYTVKVTYNGASNSTTFTVGRLGLGTFQVSDAGTYDAAGNPTSSFLRTQLIQISATLTNTDIISQNYTYIAQVKDSRGRVVFIGWISSTLRPGQTVRQTVGTSINTPDTYTATLAVWDNLQIPTPLTETVTLTLTVR